MEFSVTNGALAQQRAGCIVAGVFAQGRLSRAAMEIDAVSDGAITAVLASGDLAGEPGTTLLLRKLPNIAADRVLLVGLGEEADFAESRYRQAVGAAVKALCTTGSADAVVCLADLPVKARDTAWRIEQAVLAASEELYRFDALKSKPEPAPALDRIALHADDDASSLRGALERARAVAQGVTLARDLGNLPGNLCTPTYLADQAREVGARHNFRVEILGPPEIEQLGMGAFLAVARGSLQPPRLVVVEYRGGAEGAQPIVLVGKGITFDAGGISIKPAPEMDEMKFDMCGAASVFGALRAAALMQLPLHVVGIIPATENMPGGNAVKPGDIVTTMSGQTVEILDTDSEGRLVLCDALTYAQKYRPAAIVDIATLTGEVVSALGGVAHGLFSNDDALARELLAAGDEAWDRAWQLPLWDDYQDVLASNFADLPNIGSDTAGAGAITAACFLSRFTRGLKWAHLDVAGTASRSGKDKGATGRPVALLAHFLAARAR
jgi:leucyl aminopeptidase